jgi:hypothetical protein
MFNEKSENYIESKHQIKRNKRIRFDFFFNFNIKQSTIMLQI